MRTPPDFAAAVLDAVTDALEAPAEAGATPIAKLTRTLADLVDGQNPGDVELGPFTKIDDEQRMVWGWASVVTKLGEPIYDRQGDMIEVPELQKAVHSFMDGHHEDRPLGNMHLRIGVGTIRDSIVLTKDVQKALGIDLGCEGWFVGAHVDDDHTWAQIKSGELSAFSIGGAGTRHSMTKAAETKDGLPASAFAYVGDASDPSTWKLPYKTADGAVDTKHLAGAMAALSSGGFRGNRVSLPARAVAGVKAKLRAAHKAKGGSPSDLPDHMLAKQADADSDDDMTCPTCDGDGMYQGKRCKTCDGSGSIGVAGED